MIEKLESLGLSVNSVVITQYKDQPSATAFRNKLTHMGVKTYIHYPIKGYPTDIDSIVSESGYGANEYRSRGDKQYNARQRKDHLDGGGNHGRSNAIGGGGVPGMEQQTSTDASRYKASRKRDV